MFFLPETLGRHQRRAFDWKRANPLGGLLPLRNYRGIGWIVSVMFLFWLAHVVYPVVWPFVSDYRYGWGPLMISLSLGVFGISAVVMGVALPFFVKRYGEWSTTIIGLVFCFIGFLGYTFAWEGLDGVRRHPRCLLLGGSADPALRAIAAAGVPASEQGDLGNVDQPVKRDVDRRAADVLLDLRQLLRTGRRHSFPRRALFRRRASDSARSGDLRAARAVLAWRRRGGGRDPSLRAMGRMKFRVTSGPRVDLPGGLGYLPVQEA